MIHVSSLKPFKWHTEGCRTSQLACNVVHECADIKIYAVAVSPLSIDLQI